MRLSGRRVTSDKKQAWPTRCKIEPERSSAVIFRTNTREAVSARGIARESLGGFTRASKVPIWGYFTHLMASSQIRIFTANSHSFTSLRPFHSQPGCSRAPEWAFLGQNIPGQSFYLETNNCLFILVLREYRRKVKSCQFVCLFSWFMELSARGPGSLNWRFFLKGKVIK